MILAHGIDIVEVDRVRRMVHEHGDAFLHRVYTAAEREHCLQMADPAERLAGRFAAKEAVMKLLGTGLAGGITWTDVEITASSAGAPLCRLHNTAKALADQCGLSRILVSISHTHQLAMASAIGMGDGIQS
jgi:holo-[acyl-carrier protein] synthase